MWDWRSSRRCWRPAADAGATLLRAKGGAAVGRGGTYPSVGSVPVLWPAAGAAAAAGVADGRLSQLFRRFHCGVLGRLLEKGLSAHHVFLRVLHLLVRRPLPVLFSFARPPDGGQIPCAHRAPYCHGAADPAGLPEIRQAAAPRGQRLSEAELETPECRFRRSIFFCS